MSRDPLSLTNKYMIVFSAFVPHSPLLLPTIGKENTAQLQKTIDSLKELETQLYASKPDGIIIFSAHAPTSKEHFDINLSPQYVTDFSKFGDHASQLRCVCDSEMILSFKSKLESNNIPVHIVSEEKIDYGFGIPLWYLTQNLSKISVIPLGPSQSFSVQDHFLYGECLNKEIHQSNKRIAIIASGDLAHRKDQDKDACDAYEAIIRSSIESNNPRQFILESGKLLNAVSGCSTFPLVMLFGSLSTVRYRARILSYEAPFQVGQMVAAFDFV